MEERHGFKKRAQEDSAGREFTKDEKLVTRGRIGSGGVECAIRERADRRKKKEKGNKERERERRARVRECGRV